ncbi:MAG: AMP-binding protein [Candidatus Binatia bacterium]
MNLAATILARLGEEPERAAVVVLDVDGNEVAHYSRGELHARTSLWSARLRLAGLAPGDQVALCPARDLDLPALHLAALSGAISVVPLNASLTSSEITTLLLDSKPKLVVTEPGFAIRHVEAAEALERPWWMTTEPTDGLHPPFGLAPEVDGAGDIEAVEVDDQHEAVVLYTSGTTGMPKNVPLTHANLRSNLDTLAEIWRRTSGERLLHMLPAHHFHGLALGLYGTLLVGGTLLLLPKFDARAAIGVIARGDVDVVMGVPTMYSRILKAAREGTTLNGLRLAVSGSAPLSPELWEGFRDRFGVELVERYGLTETGILTTNPLDAPRAGSAGKVLPGTKLVIRDEDRYVRPVRGRESPRGEICVAGPSVATGYGNDPDATVAAFHDELFHTGDLGRVDADGYLWLDGRLKDLIIVGGSNVIPGEVERALSWVEGVAELAVCGAPDADLGEIVAVYVVADAGAGSRADVETSLRTAAEEALAPYKRPRRYVFVGELPRNTMGKIDRRRLRAAA